MFATSQTPKEHSDIDSVNSEIVKYNCCGVHSQPPPVAC